MRHTEVVLENARRYSETWKAKYEADGKLDASETALIFKAIIINQSALALAIRDVYDLLSRIEGQLKHNGARGAIGR